MKPPHIGIITQAWGQSAYQSEAVKLGVQLFRIVSLGSIIGALVVNILMVVLGQPLPYILFSLMGGIYVIVRHQGNIKRLLAGTEPKIGQKVQQSSEVS